jgi:hypothetical protein
MNTSVALAILIGSVFLGIVMYKRGTAALFGMPRSHISLWILGAIVSANMLVSLGALLFGGRWMDVLPWCSLLLFMYFSVRGSLLLMQSPNRSAYKNDGTGDVE